MNAVAMVGVPLAFLFTTALLDQGAYLVDTDVITAKVSTAGDSAKVVTFTNVSANEVRIVSVEFFDCFNATPGDTTLEMDLILQPGQQDSLRVSTRTRGYPMYFELRLDYQEIVPTRIVREGRPGPPPLRVDGPPVPEPIDAKDVESPPEN